MKDGLADTPSIEEYLCRVMPKDSTIGVDGMLFSVMTVEQMRTCFESAGLKLNTCFNPVDELWSDRPALPNDAIFVHDDCYNGENLTLKIGRVLGNAKAAGANSVFLSGLDEIAWVLNIRSNDVPCNPVATAFLFLSDDRKVLFINEEKVDDTVRQYLASADVDVAPYADVARFLTLLPASQRVLIEPARTADTLAVILGARAVKGASPVAMIKAVKNAVQLAGLRKAMERDGAALVRLFMEIERRLKAGETVTELDVADFSRKYRGESDMYFDESFDMIAGYGPHGAIVHYKATPESSSTLRSDGLLLVDSGAQYLDGTTDIT
ncbi:MAG: aminopeptidase P family N-terminal domain-containing protein, partial [Muribaculaceae bacterium]|nr:aminopeptidase P family N-terminal domain-containing protein [Muribaculaceae bacterium]